MVERPQDDPSAKVQCHCRPPGDSVASGLHPPALAGGSQSPASCSSTEDTVDGESWGNVSRNQWWYWGDNYTVDSPEFCWRVTSAFGNLFGIHPWISLAFSPDRTVVDCGNPKALNTPKFSTLMPGCWWSSSGVSQFQAQFSPCLAIASAAMVHRSKLDPSAETIWKVQILESWSQISRVY